MFSISSECQDSINKIIGEIQVLKEEPNYKSDNWATEAVT